MICNSVCGEKLSLLGFGAMRMPVSKDGTVDEVQVKEMVAYAMSHGVNYFDTGYAYHGGQSERVIGRVLKEYPRDSFYLATKYPGHQFFSDGHNPKRIFEEQLQKCGVEYFDFYLLHNVYEKSMEVYLDPQLGILDYFLEQKRLGRIRHLGFSSHASTACLKEFLQVAGKHMEFCQIQLNYLDWTLQDAKGKCELLQAYDIPVWVMEPVRGGRLAKLRPEEEALLKVHRPDESSTAWCFRFLQGIPNVKMVLSGMSNLEQVVENVKTFTESRPLSGAELDTLLELAERMKDAVPCTGCRYCCDGCPMGLDIPGLISLYNDAKFDRAVNVAMRVEFMPDNEKPTACIGCGKCTQICPQNIDVPGAMRDFTERLKQIPSWVEACREREKLAKGQA